MQQLGDFAEDATVELFFNTTDKTNSAPITLAGSPVVSVYKSGTTTEITTGVTLTVDYDSRTGMHRVVVDMSASASYTTGAEYKAVITTGTVDSTSVVGTEVASWSCENRFQEVDVVKVAGAAAANNAGKFEVDVTHADGAVLDVDAAQFGVKVISTANNAITNSSLADNTLSATKIADNAITSVKTDSSFIDEIEDAVQLVIVTNRLDELMVADSDIDGAAPPATGSVFFELMSKSGVAFTFDQTQDSLEALHDLAATLGTQVSLDTIYDDMPTAAENGAAAAVAVWSDTLGGYSSSQAGGALVIHITDLAVLAADWLNNGRLDNILDARASQASVDDVPTVAEFEARTLLAASYATASAQSTAQTDLTQIKADLPTRPTKNVALSNFPFIMRLSSDHVTGATGKTVTATRRLDNGTFAACANAPTEVAAGTYTIDLANTDMNANTIMLRFTAADCDDTFILIVTQP